MNNIMTRLFMVILLMMFSMGVQADVKVLFGENGDDEFTGKGGTIEVSQEPDEKDDTKVIVTLTVIPQKNYTISRDDIKVYATLPTGSRSTRGIEISSELKLEGDDPKDLSEKRDYTVTLDSKLALWVREAEFQKKGDGTKSTDPYEGTWYITNGNNYYLCPAAGYHNGNVETPYITTYQTGKDNSSVWTIVKAEVSGETYYRIIHNATGKYITANDAVSGLDAGYVRLHLESFDTPTDATLFIIVTYNGKIGIRSKDYNDAANNNYWFDISQGNKGNLWQDNGQGQLGFWYNITTDAGDNIVPADAKGAPWTFSPATPVCATPIISYNETEGTFSISYIGDDTGVTIHYTTDGTEPTSSSTTYSGAIAASSVTTKLRAIAVKTDYNNSEEAVVYGTAYSATPHLFKTSDYQTVDGVNSYYNFSYYLISPVDDDDATENRNYLTTSNVPNARMQWLIKPATASNGVQYHYLVNAETGKYVYFTGTNINQSSKFVVKARDEVGTEDDRFMFRIWEGTADGIDYFNFSPKLISGYPPSHKKENMLTKQNPTDNTNPTGVYRDDNTNGRARWQMVDVPADPKTLSALPSDMVSTTGNSVYFKLRNAAQTNNTDYFVFPPASAAYATAATTGSNPEWFFVEATDADTWNTYYYIRNAQTDHYLYFDGTTKYNDNNNKFLTSDEIVFGSEDKYKFLVLKTANTTYSGTYHIVPKQFKNNNNQANIALNRNNATLRTSQSRATNASCWYLDATDFKCESPTFSYASGKLTITCSTSGAAIYYAIGTSEPTISETNRYTAPVTLPEGITAVTAIAVRNTDGSDKSDAATFTLEIITSGDQITNMSGYYTLASNFTPSSTPIGTAANPFRGTIDGQLNSFSISHPMFYYVENAVIKNVILDNVSISSGISSEDDDNGNTGVIACVAKGTTRIYNCGILATNSTVTTDDDGYTHITSNSSTVGGSKYVGGLVGFLDDEARVINCFSYADITGGEYVGGIVGYNNVATTSANLKTMVMNCMFYGDITGGNNKAPIYNGTIITNVKDNSKTGVGNYNYFSADASYVQNRDIDTYNCALLAETRFLQRFEFFRLMLNSNRELAAWWATGDATNKDVMMKWVQEPSQIGSSTPFPILKIPGRYPSVVNYDIDNASTSIGSEGTLSVSIRMGSGGKVYGNPDGASIINSSLSLNITGKDPDHFNFNHYKVQLPYYNDVGTNNYTSNRVVTGWKIVEINGSSTGTGAFSTGSDVTITTTENVETITMPYNFADRSSTKKDLYSQSGRIFNQGAYWDVPEGVTSITIEPYWAKAAYCGDEYWDVVFTSNMETRQVVETTGGGKRFDNDTNMTIVGSPQKVYTTIEGARNALFSGIADNTAKGYSVYDNAVVLIGNCRQFNGVNGEEKRPYTVMSIDLDNDNEPDYSLALRFNGRTVFHPARYDFLNFIGLGMAQKSAGSTGSYNFGIAQPKWWFEMTNTSTFRVTQFEYDAAGRTANPLIIQGGVFEQWVAGQTNTPGNKTTYYHLGGNVWFKEFQLGVHQDNDGTCLHSPISITGGDYGSLHLTNLYKAITNFKEDNAECYINGGRFGDVAGAGMEGIGKENGADDTGNIFWQIDNADIEEFYGGGINAVKPVRGNIRTIISNSRVGLFCGGPKFGDMSTEKTVITIATNCEFGTFFGAGYGGTSYSRFAPKNYDSMGANTTWGWGNMDWNGWVNGTISKDSYGGYKQDYNSERGGVSTQIDYQFLPMSNNNTNVMRLFLDYASFSLATTHNVTSALTGCTITNNFYGGGNLGKVDGPVSSTLTNCTVNGSVFGAGYSASIPTVKVMNTGGFPTPPYYDSNLGVYLSPEFPATVTYTWKHANTVNSTSTAIDKTNHILYTNVDIETSNLGSVNGDVILTLKGDTKVGTMVTTTNEETNETTSTLKDKTGNVFGGGESSYVTGASHTVTVNIQGDTEVFGNVFGGGDKGEVQGSATVNISNPTTNNSSSGEGSGEGSGGGSGN